MSLKQQPSPLFLFTNGPGEISTWVTPFLTQLSQTNPHVDVFIFLTPCQFATGREKQICEALPLVKSVFTPKESITFVFGPSLKPSVLQMLEKTASNTQSLTAYLQSGNVLFFGGDPWYARLLGWRLSLPRYAYSEYPAFPEFGFHTVFYRDSIGDLMNDKINLYQLHQLKNEHYPSEKTIDILIFCGSRPTHFRLLGRLIARTLEYYLKSHTETLTICLGVSPYVSPTAVQELMSEFPYVFDHPNISIRQESSLQLLQMSKVLVTIPGSNTAEAMYMKVPQLVIIPLNNPEELIFNGLLGLICKIPGIGKPISKTVLFLIAKLNKQYSLPNIISQSKAVSEKPSIYTPSSLMDTILSFYKDRRGHEKQLEILAPYCRPEMASDTIASVLFTNDKKRE